LKDSQNPVLLIEFFELALNLALHVGDVLVVVEFVFHKVVEGMV
jgi:hypothetical protein